MGWLRSARSARGFVLEAAAACLSTSQTVDGRRESGNRHTGLLRMETGGLSADVSNGYVLSEEAKIAMDAAGSNSVRSDDDLQKELQAALADIEKMSGGIPVAVVTPGDDRGETVDSSSKEYAAPPQPESATGQSTAADDVSTTDVEALHASPGDADTAEPAPTVDEGPSASAAPGRQASTEAPHGPSPNGGVNDPAPITENTPPAPSEADASVPAMAETTAPSYESMLLADEALAAELARLEQMSSEEAAAIPSLDDGTGQTEDPATPADQGAFAGSEPASGSETRPEDEELTATLAEAKKAVANLPQPGAANADAPDRSAEPKSAVGNEPQREAAPAAPHAVRKKPRFQVGEKPAESVAVYRPPEEHRYAGPLPRPVVPLGKRLSRAVDNGLDTINQPFERIDGRKRTLLGCVAATTLVISILAMILMPLLMPHRDAIVFLQEKKAALNAPPPVEKADETSAGDEQTP